MKDIFGTAILDYQLGNYSEDLITSTSISEADYLPLPYLFRNYSEMPCLEKTALKLSRGTVLDIGCGAGSHSLYLKSKGLKVKSIDISAGAIEACRLRGLRQAHVLNVMDETSSFDTLLLLMNGSGVFQSLANTPFVLSHLKKLINLILGYFERYKRNDLYVEPKEIEKYSRRNLTFELSKLL